MPNIAHRREGFTGQHLVVLPHKVILQMERHPLLRGLFPTATGYFPEAPGHLVKRTKGLPEMIVIVCFSGCGWLRLDHGERIAVHPNEAAVIPPDVPHAYGAEESWSIMWAHCRGEDLRHFPKLLGVTKAAPLVRLPAGAFERMEFSMIYQQLERGYTLANLIASAARLRFALAEINRQRIHAHPRSRPSEDSLQQSIEWMSRNAERRVTLAGLARNAGMSVPHYSALFRRKTGFAPIDYFLRRKIQRACQLLDTTAMRVEEVAGAVGCEDAYYFSRLFKKIMGQPPRVYRKVQKG